MLRFMTLKTHNWNARVNQTIRRGGQSLLESRIPNPAFPWAELRLHTDVYLSKKGTISTEECDRQLLSLIKKHGWTHIAVAACAHRISVNALRDFLFSELQNSQGPQTRETLQALITAHHANPLTFTESDSQIAQALVQIFADIPKSATQILEALVKLMTSRILSHSFHYPFVCSITQTYAAKSSSEIKALENNHSWLEAHRDTKWLSVLLIHRQNPSGEEAKAIAILSEQFPGWKLWAEWIDSDTELAQALQDCRQPGSAIYKLRRLIMAQVAEGFPRNEVLHLDARMQAKMICAEASIQVKSLVNAQRWLLARKETQWLTALVEPSIQSSIAGTEAVEVLNADFPEWKQWTEWSNSDTQLAHTLAACQQHDSNSCKLERLVKVQIVKVPHRNSLLILEACKQLKSFAIQLSLEIQNLMSSQQWLAAHKETQWLSLLLDPSLQSSPAVCTVMTLLETHFPDWKAWAGWRDSDSQLAQALAPCAVCCNVNASQKLKTVMDLLFSGIPDRSLLRSPTLELARTLSIEVAKMLHALREEGQWFKAWKESQWLSMLLNQQAKPCSGWIEALDTMQHLFVDWRAWAVWRPDYYRLRLQERLSAKDRASLYDLLALEGPDFLSKSKATLREALIVNDSLIHLLKELDWGKTRLKVQNGVLGGSRGIYERLSNVVDAACATSAHVINLLVYLCCNGSPIDDDTLNILEATNLMASPQVSADVLIVLQSKFEDGGTSQKAALMRLLSALAFPSGQDLRKVLSPLLVQLVSTSMREMQGMLRIEQESLSSASSLYDFGKGVQAVQWVLPLLDNTLGTLISRWPTTGEMTIMSAIQHSLRSRSSHPLIPKLCAYRTGRLVGTNSVDLDIKTLIEALIKSLQQRSDLDRTALAYAIAQDEKLSIPLRCDCLNQLPMVPNGFIKDLTQLLDMTTTSHTWIDMVHTLTALESLDHDGTACWRSVLYIRIKDPKPKWLEHALSELTVERWFQWLSDLQTIFADRILEDSHACPDFLKAALHEWSHRIYRYRGTILRLESEIGHGPAIQSLLVGFKFKDPENIIQIIELIECYYQSSGDDGNLRPEVRATITLLDSGERENSNEIRLALSSLEEASEECGDICLRILEAYQQGSKKVAHVLIVVWLKYPGLNMIDEWALESLADVLGISLEDDRYPVSYALDAAGHYVTHQVDSLLVEAAELDRLKRSLKVKDPEGLSALLAELEIEDVSLLEDEIANLPPELLDVVEIVAEDIVEMHFPLNHLTALQRAGMGTASCGSLIVRLVVGNSSLPSGFCIHFEDKMDDFADYCGHSPWLVLDDSNHGGTSSCHGRVNRTTFQLGYVLSRHLLGAPKSLEETYIFLKESLNTQSSNCIICGTAVGVQLRRSGVCKSLSCNTTFLAQANINVHSGGLQEDAEVGDLLLRAATTAAASGNAALLPGCPVGAAQVTQLLSNLPSIKSILNTTDTGDASGLVGKESIDLLKWIFAQYGGFLVSASRQMRIPGIPGGVIQFLLANAAPNLEKAFAAQMGAQPTRVVFHGTSLDRLYSILCKGLQVCSGNSALQRHGAALGNGIYVADEPSTSMTYALRHPASYAGSASQSSSLNVGVLLACEASGNISSKGIHVISNPDMLILRYIFLVPTGVSMPQARHIVPAITSVFASLRSGSL